VRGRTKFQFVDSFSSAGAQAGIFSRWVLLCSALAAAASPVHAADLPSKTEPVVLEPTPAEFRWTGFYAGVNVGGGIDHFGFLIPSMCRGHSTLFKVRMASRRADQLGAFRPGLIMNFHSSTSSPGLKSCLASGAR
jgi:hypothetical protein